MLRYLLNATIPWLIRGSLLISHGIVILRSRAIATSQKVERQPGIEGRDKTYQAGVRGKGGSP